jgi:hypothetical protein
MKSDMLQCGYLRADETEARFRDPDKPGTTGRGRFWLYKGLNGNVIFDWTLGRDHHYFLDWIGQDFEGILASDAYEVYPKYCRLQKARGKKTRRPAGPLGKAVRYLLNQGDDIETYIQHGQVEIDTGCGRATRTPRDVRPLAVGRKNWLFVGSPEAGERSAIIYSLLISARHHGADREAYLRDLIDRLPSCGSDEASLRQLLPENWAAVQKQSASQPAARAAA